ncbi:MAG: hypothetical protein LBK57_05110 [Clostridiales Family XIII bacterium]|jgi:hypothetical protein|nr:hypothetical protein [Clostridiales Family XIII bacterium]
MKDMSAGDYLDEGYLLMSEFGFDLPAGDETEVVAARARKALGGAALANEITAALTAFFLSRKLYETENGSDGARVLLSDYFVSLAVKLVLPLKNSPIVDEMAARLEEKALSGARLREKFDLKEYLDFIDKICKKYLEHTFS